MRLTHMKKRLPKQLPFAMYFIFLAFGCLGFFLPFLAFSDLMSMGGCEGIGYALGLSSVRGKRTSSSDRIWCSESISISRFRVCGGLLMMVLSSSLFDRLLKRWSVMGFVGSATIIVSSIVWLISVGTSLVIVSRFASGPLARCVWRRRSFSYSWGSSRSWRSMRPCNFKSSWIP